jgi:hypothetical protein
MTDRVRTSLCNAPSQPADDREIFELARRLWREKGIPFFPDPKMVEIDLVRVGMFGEAERVYGRSKVEWR